MLTPRVGVRWDDWLSLLLFVVVYRIFNTV